MFATKLLLITLLMNNYYSH